MTAKPVRRIVGLVMTVGFFCNGVRQLSVISGYRAGESAMSQYEGVRAIVADDAELEAFAARIRR